MAAKLAERGTQRPEWLCKNSQTLKENNGPRGDNAQEPGDGPPAGVDKVWCGPWDGATRLGNTRMSIAWASRRYQEDIKVVSEEYRLGFDGWRGPPTVELSVSVVRSGVNFADEEFIGVRVEGMLWCITAGRRRAGATNFFELLAFHPKLGFIDEDDH